MEWGDKLPLAPGSQFIHPGMYYLLPISSHTPPNEHVASHTMHVNLETPEITHKTQYKFEFIMHVDTIINNGNICCKVLWMIMHDPTPVVHCTISFMTVLYSTAVFEHMIGH